MAHGWFIKDKARKMETAKSFKIFILDDDAFCRGIYEQHLKNLGFTDIKSFDECYDCFVNLTEQPDILFLDNLTKPSNGIEVLKAIKRFNSDIHVVIMTAHEDMRVALRAQKYGAFGYIIKGEKDVEMITSVMKKITKMIEAEEKPQVKKSNKLFILLNLF